MDPFTGMGYHAGGGSYHSKKKVRSAWHVTPPKVVNKAQWDMYSDTSSEASDLSSLVSSIYSYETTSSQISSASSSISLKSEATSCSQTSSSSGSSGTHSTNSATCSLTSSSAPSSHNSVHHQDVYENMPSHPC